MFVKIVKVEVVSVRVQCPPAQLVQRLAPENNGHLNNSYLFHFSVNFQYKLSNYNNCKHDLINWVKVEEGSLKILRIICAPRILFVILGFLECSIQRIF